LWDNGERIVTVDVQIGRSLATRKVPIVSRLLHSNTPTAKNDAMPKRYHLHLSNQK
jgi:hypothetical protein